MARLPFKIGDLPIQGNFDALVKAFDLLTSRTGALETRASTLEATPLHANVDTGETTTSTTYVDLTTVGPSLIVPVAGNYVIDCGCYVRSSVGTGSNLMSYAVGGTGASDADSARFDCTTTSSGASVVSSRKKTALAAGTVITAKYRVSANTGQFFFRWLKLSRVV